MTNNEKKTAPFNEIQGIASTNVPAYSNQYDDFISFEGFYIRGIYTGFKWQCVEYARRWLLLRKSCIFHNFESAADMWQELKYIDRVTDGQQFSIKIHSNGSPHKPNCDDFLIYPRGEGIPFGHVAVICEVQENFIHVAEQNYQFHYWPGNYSRQISMVKRDGLYYIEDSYTVYGWIEIENNDQLKPLNQSDSILQKYQKSKPIGKLEHCFIRNKYSDYQKENFLMPSDDQDRSYCKADEDFFLNISRVSNELYQLFIQATENIIHNDELLIGFGIPKQFWSLIRRSWKNERDFGIIDHLEFKFDGKKLKLCQFRTDNALTILESASLQEKKVQAMNLKYEFTSNFQLHRLLVRNWKRFNINTTVHILMGNDEEEMMTALYMKKVITEAGIESKLCTLPNDLCWKDSDIVDKDGQIVKIVWKLWNWERIFQDYLDRDRDNEEEQNGWRHQNPCLSDILLNDQIRIIEPIWKSITSCSAFLPVLCMMFPDHPNILQEQWILPEDSQPVPFLNGSMDEQTYENSIMGHFRIDESMKGYFNYDYLPQAVFPRKNSDETIVSWIINGLFSGFSIRDDQNPIIDTTNSLKCCCVI